MKIFHSNKRKHNIRSKYLTLQQTFDLYDTGSEEVFYIKPIMINDWGYDKLYFSSYNEYPILFNDYRRYVIYPERREKWEKLIQVRNPNRVIKPK